MLKKFSVTNFKNFKTKLVFDLSKPANYEFNSEIVRDNTITKGIIYGMNGSGKSNLALAIFDIVLHLTDKEKSIDKYYPYLNLDSNKKEADFEYVFEFDGSELIYQYSKTDPLSLVNEKVIIDRQEVINYDYLRKSGYTNLSGAEKFQLLSSLSNESDKLSRVKYIKSNTILNDTKDNKVFLAFTSFVDKMLMFCSIDEKRYQGFDICENSFTEGIVKDGKVKELELFLNEKHINYNLIAFDVGGQKELYCKFDNSSVPFRLVASTGTQALSLFYYRYLKMSQASFVFIDDFDAFYYFKLSKELVIMVKQLTGTQVFFTTHNTDLLSNELMRPDVYFEIYNNKINSLEKKTDKEIRFAHNIQKMFKADTFKNEP